MINTTTLDVLVVYTQRIATSASTKNKNCVTPFTLAKSREHYSAAYSYFLKKCAQKGLLAAFTTSSDIIGPGLCKSYWVFENDAWKKIKGKAFAPIIFDKVSPLRESTKKKRELLFSKGISQPFNDRILLQLFNDKLKTYKQLSDFTIPTVNVTKDTVKSAIERLQAIISTHKNNNDFTEKFVLKDRFGGGGEEIYMIDKNPVATITTLLQSSPTISFILQPFTKFDKGYSHNGKVGFTDIRIIYSQGKIVQRYLRTAKKGDFRCNEHQGGKVTYVSQSSIPQCIKDASRLLLKKLNGENALFALDFIVSNKGNAYFLEGNINPGIYWGLSSYEDKVNTKKLIRTIIQELYRRTEIVKSDLLPVDIKIKQPVFPITTPLLLTA